MSRRIRQCAILLLGFVTCLGAARAATVTDSTTFNAFSVSYDAAVWGPIRFAHEADSFTGTLPVDQFGFGRFFLDPGFGVSSDGSSGPAQLAISGQIVITAKPGWGLYNVNFTQSGQWATVGSGFVSVAGSIVDILANGDFFYDDQRAFVDLLAQGPDGANGYYYIIRERSSFSRFGEMTIDYDIQLTAMAADTNGFARLASDPSDPSFLGGTGPYPASNIVGTFISVSYERVTLVSEPSGLVLLIVGLLALSTARRSYARPLRR